MSYKNDLAVELAEVASGQRSQVSSYTSYFAEAEERGHRKDLQRAADEQAEAAWEQAQAAQDAADAARHTLALTQHAVQMQQAHQFEMEAAAAERNRLIEEAAEEKLEFEKSAHAERLRIDQERHSRDLEERRLLASPTYSTVKKMLELSKLERWIQEGHELEDLLRPAVTLWEDLKKAVRRSDAEVRAQHKAAVAAADAEEVQVTARRAAAIANVEAELAKILEEHNSNAEQRKTCVATLSPITWFGERAKVRRDLEAVRFEIAGRVAECEGKLARLKTPRAYPAVKAPVIPARAERIMELCDTESGGLNDLEEEISNWHNSDDRSPEASTLLYSEAFADEQLEIDYDLCVTLDHARASGAEIEYPGLGVVPFGAQLVKVVNEIRSLRQCLPGFCNGGAEPIGLDELKWLRNADLTGKMEGESEAEKKLEIGDKQTRQVARADLAGFLTLTNAGEFDDQYVIEHPVAKTASKAGALAAHITVGTSSSKPIGFFETYYKGPTKI